MKTVLTILLLLIVVMGQKYAPSTPGGSYIDGSGSYSSGGSGTTIYGGATVTTDTEVIT